MKNVENYVSELQNNGEYLEQLIEKRERIEELIEFDKIEGLSVEQVGTIHAEITQLLESQDIQKHQEALSLLMENVTNKAIDNLYGDLDELDIKSGDIYSACQQAFKILLKYFDEALHDVVTGNKDFKYLITQTGHDNYVEDMIVRSGITTSVNIFGNYISELTNKGVSNRSELLEIIKKNSRNIIDSAKSRNLGILIKGLAPEENGMKFDSDNKLHYNISQEKIDGLVNQFGDTQDTQVAYRGCPMLYSKGGRTHNSNIIDWSHIVVELISRGMKWEGE